MEQIFKSFPSQKKSYRQKTKEWFKKCIDSAEDMILFSDSTIRQSRVNKKINYNLYNDILSESDMKSSLTPLGISSNTFPATLRNYPIITPKFDVLAGEELKRNFDARVTVTNQDAISSKEEAMKDDIMGSMQSLLLEDLPEDAEEEQVEEKLKQLHKYYRYDWQDIREIAGTKLINHYKRELNTKEIFNRGFYDLLITAEEIYRVSEISGEPHISKCNPLNVFYLSEPDNPYIDNSDLILEEEYKSIGSVIDEFYDYLSEKDINKLEGMLGGDQEEPRSPSFSAHEYLYAMGEEDDIHDTHPEYSGDFDMHGNIRVLRVTWLSRKKIGKRTYQDEFGDEVSEWVSEEYIPNPDDPTEEVEWLWINEYCEGTKIGRDTYVKLRVKPHQFRSVSNPSKCKSGYFGGVHNINDSRAVSLMDRLKPYQYFYNILMYRTELAIAKNKGKIAELDLAKVPDHWTPEKWMYYAEALGFMVVDSFKEGNKGRSTGTLAGNMNTTGRALDLETGNYIQQHINLLEYIKQEIDEISGVNKQRQGGVSGRDGLGVTEQAIVQASHITEPLFKVHENIKARVMGAVLEVAKYCIREKDEAEFKFQHILDDMTTNIIKIDSEMFLESDYGLITSDSGKDLELINNLKQLAHAGIQNDKLTFSDLIDIFTTDSVAKVSSKIKQAEAERAEQAQQAQQQAVQVEQEKVQAEMEDKEKERELKKYKTDADNITKIRVAQISAYKLQQDWDKNQDGIDDPSQIAEAAFEERKQTSEEFYKQQELENKKEEARRKEEVEKDKNRVKEKEIESKEKTEKYKADKQLEIAKENQTKSELIADGKVKKDKKGKVRKT